jgi:hypothetical protein
MLGWKIVPKDDYPEDDYIHRYPYMREDDFRPDWAG